MPHNAGKSYSHSYKGQNRQRRRNLGSPEKMKLRHLRAFEWLYYYCPVSPLECKERSQCHLVLHETHTLLYMKFR